MESICLKSICAKSKTMRNYIQCVTHHKPLPNINNVENVELKKKTCIKNCFDSNRSLNQVGACVFVFFCICLFFSLVCFAIRLESVYCVYNIFAQCATDVIPLTMSQYLTTAKMLMRQRIKMTIKFLLAIATLIDDCQNAIRTL